MARGPAGEPGAAVTSPDGIVARRVPGVIEQTATLGDQPVFWRAGADGIRDGHAPVVYLHGVPATSDAWLAFLTRTGGLAPDLPGFGRSGKRGDLDFSIDGLSSFVDAFLELVGVDRVRLVVHDWGAAAGLVWAQRAPARVERLVVINAVPLLPGFRFHRGARALRTRALGELSMGLTTRIGLRRTMPRELADAVWPHFDQGTQRAILQLLRTSPETRLAQAGAGLHRIACPALVLWGDGDPHLEPRFADAYGAALGDARVEHVPGAGHWPWYDRPELVDRVVAFLIG
jgi:pimeloyl-ACP methyl ester carboxylesterase